MSRDSLAVSCLPGRLRLVRRCAGLAGAQARSRSARATSSNAEVDNRARCTIRAESGALVAGAGIGRSAALLFVCRALGCVGLAHDGGFVHWLPWDGEQMN